MLLEAQHISKKYHDHTALSDFSVNLPEKSIVGLLGPNGAGKSTFIRIITQILKADSGKILFRGKEMTESDILQIGYLPEERGLYKKMKVKEQLVFLARLKGLSSGEAKKRVSNWLEKLQLSDWSNHKLEELSKGMQQKIQFIAAVIHEPALLILDEPFTGFDPINANLIRDEMLQLHEKGCTILYSTHRMDSVEELCDYIVLLNRSQKILDGATDEIKKRFGKNEFLIRTKDPVSSEGNSYAVTRKTPEKEYQEQVLLPKNNSSGNVLLEEILKQTEVMEFRQLLPSIEEIFINQVTSNTIK